MKYVLLMEGKPLAKLNPSGKIECLQTDDEYLIQDIVNQMNMIFNNISYARIEEDIINKDSLANMKPPFKSYYDMTPEEKRKAEGFGR